MNQFCIYIPIKPISYNQSHVVVGQVLRSSSQLIQFQRKASKLITPFSGLLKKFATSHMDQPIQMEFRYIFWLPQKELITKAGSISKKSLDIDNCMKGINDVVFKRMEKFNKNINDAFVTKMILEKKASPQNEYGVTIYGLLKPLRNVA